MKKITIRIQDGVVKTDYEGFKGNACELLDQAIRPDNAEIIDQVKKPEYHQNVNADQKELIKG